MSSNPSKIAKARNHVLAMDEIRESKAYAEAAIAFLDRLMADGDLTSIPSQGKLKSAMGNLDYARAKLEDAHNKI